MVLIWVAMRRWQALISFVAIAAGFGYIHNFIRLTNHGTEEHHDLKLMSYNVRLFNLYEESERDTHRKMLDLLKKEDPGILCLQEYFVRGDPAAGERKLKEGLGGRLYTHFKLIKERGCKQVRYSHHHPLPHRLPGRHRSPGFVINDDLH